MTAELGRRGIIASPLAGNVPDIDVLAYLDGRSVALQVKAIRTGEVSVNAARYLDIQIDETRQTVLGLRPGIDRTLIFVLVRIAPTNGQDRFYIFTQGQLQDVIRRNYENWLARHDGIRPRNPNTLHCAYRESDFPGAQDNWALITDRLTA